MQIKIDLNSKHLHDRRNEIPDFTTALMLFLRAINVDIGIVSSEKKSEMGKMIRHEDFHPILSNQPDH